MSNDVSKADEQPSLVDDLPEIVICTKVANDDSCLFTQEHKGKLTREKYKQLYRDYINLKTENAMIKKERDIFQKMIGRLMNEGNSKDKQSFSNIMKDTQFITKDMHASEEKIISQEDTITTLTLQIEECKLKIKELQLDNNKKQEIADENINLKIRVEELTNESNSLKKSIHNSARNDVDSPSEEPIITIENFNTANTDENKMLKMQISNLRVALREEQAERIELLRKFTILNAHLTKCQCMLATTNQVKRALKNNLNTINKQLITLSYLKSNHIN